MNYTEDFWSWYPSRCQKPEKNIFPKLIFMLHPPCFLESVFCQELEKTGFRIVRDWESDEIHLFISRAHLIFDKMVTNVSVTLGILLLDFLSSPETPYDRPRRVLGLANVPQDYFRTPSGMWRTTLLKGSWPSSVWYLRNREINEITVTV